MCSVVILATRADAQSAALLAPSVGPSSTLECQQLALGSLSCFHKSTSMVPLKSCPGTVVVVHLDPLWERQFRLWPSPAPMHTPCGSPHCPLGCLTDVESTKLVLEVEICNPCNHRERFQPRLCEWATHRHLLPELAEVAAGV